ncbi:MAG: hypothetical protein N3D18_12395 [Roseococcus sp.]|nr:hypothetical protein [Roseococcus sp.]
MPREMVTLFRQEKGLALLRRHCAAIGLAEQDLKDLIEEVIEKDSMARRRGLWQAFDEILDRTEEPRR